MQNKNHESELRAVRALWNDGAPVMARERLRNMITTSTDLGEITELKAMLRVWDEDPRIGGKWEGNNNVPAATVHKVSGGTAPTWADLYEKADANERAAMDKQMEEARARGW